MCIVVGWPGMSRTRTRKRLEVTFMIETKGSKVLCQRARTPPWAREDFRARSRSSLSSELRLEQNCELKGAMARGRSDWKSSGSDMKTRCGFSCLQIVRRSLETLRNPSQFHVMHLISLCAVAFELTSSLFTMASEFSELSEEVSLKGFPRCH